MKKKIILIAALIALLSLASACAAKSASLEAPAPAMDYARNDAVTGAMPMTEQSASESLAAPAGRCLRQRWSRNRGTHHT